MYFSVRSDLKVDSYVKLTLYSNHIPEFRGDIFRWLLPVRKNISLKRKVYKISVRMLLCSIPFKHGDSFKGKVRKCPKGRKLQVSIPIKRERTCEQESGWETGRFVEFQFPSNGKARVNLLENDEFHKVVRLFQFPSNGKARVNTEKSTNGIHEQRKFQFPSNGKARVNSR